MSLIRNASIDWLTMTSREDASGASWWEHYCNYRRTAQIGEPTETQYHNGFYAGVRIGQLQWGYSEHLGYILVASGEQANRTWQHYQPARHIVTRIDLAMDFSLDAPRNLASIYYDIRMEKQDRQFPKLTIWKNSSGGATLYVGSRQSQQYGRLYDKGNETGKNQNGEWWRAEVEYKKPMSDALAKQLHSEDVNERAEVIAETVKEWYSKRDIILPVNADGQSALVTKVEKRVTTSQKKLTWIRSQVAPSVAELVSVGLGREVLSALLLDEQEIRRIWQEEG